MSIQTTLKLIDPNQDEPLGFEQRHTNRHVITGRVTAVQQFPQKEEQRHRICSIELLNISDTGLGAVSDEAMELGSDLTVFFPPHGPERGFDLSGHVVRCRQRDDSLYEIGIKLQSKQAA